MSCNCVKPSSSRVWAKELSVHPLLRVPIGLRKKLKLARAVSVLRLHVSTTPVFNFLVLLVTISFKPLSDTPDRGPRILGISPRDVGGARLYVHGDLDVVGFRICHLRRAAKQPSPPCVKRTLGGQCFVNHYRTTAHTSSSNLLARHSDHECLGSLHPVIPKSHGLSLGGFMKGMRFIHRSQDRSSGELCFRAAPSLSLPLPLTAYTGGHDFSSNI